MQNKREFFRLDLYNMDVELLIGKEKYKGKVRDLSGNGISFILEDDVIFKECKVKFELKETHFHIDAQFVRRKIEREYPFQAIYACTFNTLKDSEKGKISSILLQMDAIRRRKW